MFDRGVSEQFQVNFAATTSSVVHRFAKIVIKSKLIGRKQSEETKNKLRKPKTKDHKEKLRSANLGKKQTEETKKKNSENNKGKNNPRAILTEYTFIHPEFGEFVGDRFALSEKYNIKINYLLNLVNGKISHTSGWTLKP